jgi:DNA-binding response OmpR family regulator
MPRRATVLIVEDDEGLRHMYRVALALAGFHVQEAANGVRALRSIDAHPPDAVILDMGLPIFSGVFVREEIAAHAHTRHIPIVIITGSSENFDSLNVNCVLRKPVSPEEVVEALRKCLQSGGTSTSQATNG